MIFIVKAALWFRYRIKVKGLDKLNQKNLNKEGGVLFLANHPAMFVDPLAVSSNVWSNYPLRPLVVEYMYYAKMFYPVFSYVDAIPIPNNEVAANSLKKKQSDKAFEEVIKGLKRGENFLLYPAGRLKETGKEWIGGASGAHRIVSQCPEANIVLIRTVGLWGSSFSKAYLGVSPPIFPYLWRGIKKTFKNLIFFNPRREVTIEIEPAPKDFPREGDRMEINKWLEDWYNRPEGLVPPGSKEEGEPLKRVSYSIWGKDLIELPEEREEDKEKEKEEKIEVEDVPDEIREKVIAKLSEMTGQPQSEITPDTKIASDLGLDSLDTAEIALFLDSEYKVKGIPVKELTTVGRIMEIAAGNIKIRADEEAQAKLSKWKGTKEVQELPVASGKTLPETFLNNCKKMGSAVAVGDDRSGVLTYKRLKIGALVLADFIKTLPGDHVGIMLPASVGATLAILGCQIAGKVPVMINWTIGPRHLDSVVKTSKIKSVLSSWAFLDRLGNVDITPIEDMMILLEDVKRDIGIAKKLKAAFHALLPTETILKKYGSKEITENDRAVILFTSGTEAAPKGVPLSHRNILSNVRGIFKYVDVDSRDVFLAVLPPFHSFGFTAGCFLGVTSGLRIAFFPNPTDGQGMAESVEKWKATIMCGAPTFLKGMLKAADSDQMKSLRMLVSGAEKAPQELFELSKEKGLEGKLIEGYGVTECSPVLTLNPPGSEPKGVGIPLPDVDICIVGEESHKVLSTGEQGLILARGPNIFSGYLNKDVKSPFLTIEGKEWYNTGDLGYIDEMGRVIISGRLKRFIKMGGEMISLAAIESALQEVASKQGWEMAEEGPSLAVCAKEPDGDKAEIWLFTIFDTSVDEANKALRDAGFSNLIRVTHHKKVDEIPIMGSGKVHFRELENKYLANGE